MLLGGFFFNISQVTWGCEGKVADMETEDDGRRFYYNYSPKGKKTKVYCQYDNRKGLEEAIMARRTSLGRAIEIYMEEVNKKKKNKGLALWPKLYILLITE